jgi:TusA-related sulfurtransferase
VADRHIDLCGLLCPLTWARVRRELNAMSPGQTLEVLLDHRPAVPDIRRNADAMGHDVEAALDLGNGRWQMLLRAGNPLE